MLNIGPDGATTSFLIAGGSFGSGAGAGTGPNQPDYYGKMSFHWDDNPNPADEKLELWLDPENTGQTVLHGAYPDLEATVPCGPDQACEEIADVAQMQQIAYPTRFRQVAKKCDFGAVLASIWCPLNGNAFK